METLERLRALEANKLELEKDICLLQHELQATCPHPKEEMICGLPDDFGGHAWSLGFMVCKQCGLAGELLGLRDSVTEILGGIQVLPRKEALQFVRGTIVTREVMQKLPARAALG